MQLVINELYLGWLLKDYNLTNCAKQMIWRVNAIGHVIICTGVHYYKYQQCFFTDLNPHGWVYANICTTDLFSSPNVLIGWKHLIIFCTIGHLYLTNCTTDDLKDWYCWSCNQFYLRCNVYIKNFAFSLWWFHMDVVCEYMYNRSF